jgi:hypothetical protein
MRESVEAMERRGLTVQRIEGELERRWVEYGESFQPRIRGSIVPEAAFDEIMSLVNEYRAR